MSGTDPTTVSVAPREIHDYVYRATRLTGADHGVANEIARAAVFAHVQLDSHLANVLAPLGREETPVFGLPFVIDAERAAGASFDVPDGVVVADLALHGWEASQRGNETQMTCGDGTERAPDTWLATGRANLGVVSLRVVNGSPGPNERVAARAAAVAESGARIDSEAWRGVTDAASGYLVPEREIDGQV